MYKKEITLPKEGWAVNLIEDMPTDKTVELSVTATMNDHPAVKAHTFYVTIDKNVNFPRIYYTDLHVHSEDTVGTNSTSYNLT